MNIRPLHFLRMARWARRPASEKRVKLVLGVIAIALIIFGLEWIFGTPEWMQIDSTPRGRINR